MPGLEYVALAENHFGKRFVPVTSTEYSSPDGCPRCGASGESDRFRLFLSGNSSPRVWCRRCGFLQFLDNLQEYDKLSGEDLEKFKLELQKRKDDEDRKRELAIKKINSCEDHIAYYNAMGDHLDAIEYWYREGISSESINDFKLGYCERCPTAPYSASYTIPVTYNGVLWNIRHRLVSPNGQGKYRPHLPGLPNMLFNADDLDVESKFGLLLEGEKKTIVVRQKLKVPSVGIMGMSSFSSKWAKRFDKWGSVYICLDPDADLRSEEIAKKFNGRGKVVTLPTKADDFFVKHRGTVHDFKGFLELAR